jgi:hypothetical protein
MTAEKQLATFMGRFTPEVQRLGKSVLKAMRSRFPGAIQMVYDNYNFLVVGFCPTERPSEGIFSIAMSARGVSLCFLQAGPKIPDPKKLLQGSGKQARHLPLESAAVLDEPAVKTLMSQAEKLAVIPFDPDAEGKLVIKSVSAKQRPRK